MHPIKIGLNKKLILKTKIKYLQFIPLKFEHAFSKEVAVHNFNKS